MGEWPQALINFQRSLPTAVSRWVLIYQGRFHSAIARSLATTIPIVESLDLDTATAVSVQRLLDSYQSQTATGIVRFHQRDQAEQYPRAPGLDALHALSDWPPGRIRLCFDVTDQNFPWLFAEQPQQVHERCTRLAERLRGVQRLTVDTQPGCRFEAHFDDAQWTVYSGVGSHDYQLPSGELFTLPQSIDGRFDAAGWLIGSLPFGIKYGRLQPGELLLEFKQGELHSIGGNNRPLCKDLYEAFDRLPPLSQVVEFGIGQSQAVIAAAARHQLGYLWHEKAYGVHLGLGAELPENIGPDSRQTSHHLDFVFAAGELRDSNGRVLAWPASTA
ncbi:MAG: hypothetical protein Tsb002_10980 [Wenzhouxiangellaceae bacterium]